MHKATDTVTFRHLRGIAILSLGLLQVACATPDRQSIADRIAVSVEPATSQAYLVEAINVDAAVVGVETVGGSVAKELTLTSCVVARLTRGQLEALGRNTRILSIEKADPQALAAAGLVARLD